MILRVPGKTDGGIVTDALVEHVDIMATLAEAAGLAPVETCPEKEPWKVARCTEGTSLLPLIANPNASQWKNASYSQYPRYGNDDPKGIMGYSMTTATLRFTAWVDFLGRFGDADRAIRTVSYTASP